MEVLMVWNGYLERWILKDSAGYNIYEFPDCINTNRVYPNLDKTKVNIYKMVQAEPLQKLDIG